MNTTTIKSFIPIPSSPAGSRVPIHPDIIITPGDTVQDSQTAAQPAAARLPRHRRIMSRLRIPYPISRISPTATAFLISSPRTPPGYQASNDQTQYPNYGGGAVPPTNPMSGYNVGGSEPPKKKGGVSGKVVVAAALVCVLIGGAVAAVCVADPP